MREPSKSRRIVLVDDEEALVWSLASRLTKIRPRDKFEVANDGGSALAFFSKEPVDLLVADIRMPGMSGIDLVIALRREFPELPAILMTAFKSPDEIERVVPGPFTGLLEKPFEFDQLLELVDHALSPTASVGFSGAISVQTLPDIVQLYALSSATGLLGVKHAGDIGEIWFDRGNICHASTKSLKGDDAFFSIMHWSSGEFFMRAGASPPERSVKSHWQELLIESCRRIDEAARGKKPRDAIEVGWTHAPPSVADEASFQSIFSSLRPPADAVPVASSPTTPVTSLSPNTSNQSSEVSMNVKESIAKLNQVDGFIAGAIVDSESGMLVGSEGGHGINLEVAAAGNSEVVKAKRKTMNSLNLKDNIEDILVTLGKHYHIIRPLRTRPTLFFYLVLDRARANLAMARIGLADIEKELQV